MKKSARLVVVGGGVVGASVAYHLCHRGCSDVVLLEMDELTSGSTWHAAGNVPTYSTSRNIIKLQYYSTQLYPRLAEEVGYPIGYHKTGSIRLARNHHRLEEFQHVCSMANAMGIAYQMLDNDGLKAKYPFLDTDGVHGGLWDPNDGDIDPSQLTQAFARGARSKGADIRRFTRVVAIEHEPSGDWLVRTDKGDISCEIVVNASGYRGAEIAAMVGQSLPSVSMQHQYLVTESVSDLVDRQAKLPLLRDPDDSYYLRQERDGLLLGPYEWQATPAWADGRLPENFAHGLFPDDLDRLEWYIEAACKRVPILGTAGVQRVINGAIPYSPDGYPFIGPAYGLENFYHCCTFSFGICQAGGAGKSMAEWIVDGRPEWDLWSLDPRRYTDYANQKYVLEKATELYQREYAIPFPAEERTAGRPARTTPVYSRLQAQGAMFGARAGWERATWFPRSPEEAREELSFHRTNWFETVGSECRAVRERVGILDLGGFSKFEVSGPGAEAWLNWMVAGGLPSLGRIALSYMCTPTGGVWSEFTVTRLADDRFYLVSAAAAEWHDYQWMKQHLPKDKSVRLDNVGLRYGTLVLAGPKSRDVLCKVTGADLSNRAFPWLSCREIEIDYARTRAFRVNYVGELGWELHVPVEFQLPVYDALWEAGQEFGLVNFGMYAMDSLRLEKCYRAWKVELDSEYSPLRSGLGRFVKLDKPDFIGKDAIAAEKAAGLPDVFVPFLVEEGDADSIYGCTISKNGRIVGYTTSGGYGYAIGSSIALGYIRADLAEEGTEVEIMIFGNARRARVATEPLYDPTNVRLRA